METGTLWVGRVSGIVGLLICAIATVTRVSGTYSLAGLLVGTVFQGGMAAMIVACLAHLIVLVHRVRRQ